MADFEAKLGRKKEEAILALLSQRSVEEAARACDTPVRTLYRWLQEPAFDAAYRAARRKAYGQAIARLQQGSTAAATTLLKVMVDPNTPASTRIRSAESGLTHEAKALEIKDLDARLSELERTAAVNEEHRRRM